MLDEEIGERASVKILRQERADLLSGKMATSERRSIARVAA